MKKTLFLLLVYLLCFLPLGAKAQEANNPVVVELFTSQSCSSCPPADKILGELSSHPNVIALGCHVTYWDHLSWKDTLSSQDCTNLQNNFNAERGSRRVYTPQMVVNGVDEFVGSNRKKAIDLASKESSIFLLNPKIENGTIMVDIPDHFKNDAGSKTLYLYGYNDDYVQDIKSGENSGLKQIYTNPVSFVESIKNWNGKNSLVIKPPANPTRFYALVLREGVAGKILAAGVTE